MGVLPRSRRPGKLPVHLRKIGFQKEPVGLVDGRNTGQPQFLDRANEATERLDGLDAARKMEAAGKDAKTVRLATGWERGADNLWRFEIPDIALKEHPAVRWEENGIGHSTLDEFIEGGELFEAYPSLRGYTVEISHAMGKANGGFVAGDRHIILTGENSAARLVPDRLVEIIMNNDGLTREDAVKKIRGVYESTAADRYMPTLVHEIQHAIQHIEGFATGGSFNEGRERYLKNAGEAEARNAVRRRDFTPEERRQKLLAETEDVAREDQIVIRNAVNAVSAGTLPYRENAPLFSLKAEQSPLDALRQKAESIADEAEKARVIAELDGLARLYPPETNKYLAPNGAASKLNPEQW
jgi:hypothetical protein